MDATSLQVEVRTALGKGLGALRRTGVTPIHVYGRAMESLSLQVPTHALQQTLALVGQTVPFTLQVDGDEPADRAAERLILALRLDQGLDLDSLPADQKEILERRQQEIQEHENAGLLWRRDGRLKLTSRGILLSNEVFRSFLP